MVLSLIKKTVETRTAQLEHDNEIEVLYRRINELEYRLENQEQYSRRTSLRFHNIRVPVDAKGNIVHPVDTDDLILKVCNDNLKINITKDDIGRSHVIGKAFNGKAQVIVRFLSYRKRELVYNAKKQLKGNEDKVFITENLTHFRTGLVKTCLELKSSNKLHAFWTSDGRIYIKQYEHSRKQLIQSMDDLLNIAHRTDRDNEIRMTSADDESKMAHANDDEPSQSVENAECENNYY